MFAHDNNIDNLFVGKRIKQNEVFYQEGTKGNVTGNHCHIECAKGKFTGTGWYKNNSGYWSINNGKKPEECLWIDDSITVLNSKYKFKKISTEIVDKKDDIKPVIRKNEFIFVAPKTDLYGVYLKEKQKLIIED